MIKVYLGLLSIVFLLAGCGGDSSSNPSEHYESVSSLGECDDDHQDDSVYVKSMDVYMTCQDGFWMEFTNSETESRSDGKSSSSSRKNNSSENGSDDEKSSSSYVHNPQSIDSLYVAADDTLFSLKYLKDCNSSHEGRYVFVISLNGYLVCSDGKWVEFKPPVHVPSSSSIVVDPKNQIGVSDLSNYFDIYKDTAASSSSSIYPASLPKIFKADSLFGKCDDSNEGKVFVDSARVIEVSADNLYYCKNRVWVAATYLDANSAVLGEAPDGTFAEAVFPTQYAKKKKMSTYCSNEIPGGEQYVMDGYWRLASDLETCFGKMCSYANRDSMYDFMGYWYICRRDGWDDANIFELKNPNFFNEDVKYGSLTDERDGQVYRTVVIDGVTWMAQNLNYKGADREFGVCYKDDPANCEISGRFYKWADYMNAADSGDVLTNQGICPDGWEVPSKTHFENLFDKYSASLYSPIAWTFAHDSYSFYSKLNTSGFTALGGTLDNPKDFWTGANRFCIVSAAGDYYHYYGVMETFLSSSTTIKKTSYDQYCNLRCIKSAVVAGEAE
ncbi:FISUMP domain-containing protein [Fibrobacter succinogenes]|uniref:FISUMP domain-containing protein n=1 Tax=Fibrobacter succinogenes TaxID=833 RepID=UPI0013CF7A27|nr:FISUMP domain-containing protein [Fibrobacter succinogenes]